MKPGNRFEFVVHVLMKDEQKHGANSCRSNPERWGVGFPKNLFS